jgi:hypothetical protein
VRADDLKREIEALDEEIAALRSLEQEEDSAVMALSAEIEARNGRLSLTRRALADYEGRMEEKRAALDEAMAEEARLVLDQVLQDREKAVTSVAEATELLLARLAALDGLQEAARSALESAESRARALGKELDAPAAAEIEAVPEAMGASWSRLCEEVRKRIKEEFEDELVNAAAQSPLGHAINELPGHLQELARQRHRALMQRRRTEGRKREAQ